MLSANSAVSQREFPLDIYSAYELSFAESIAPKLNCLNQLAFVRPEGTRLKVNLSRTTALLSMEECHTFAWNFVENTYAYWRSMPPGGKLDPQVCTHSNSS